MLEHRQGDVGLVRWPALPPGCTQVERAPGEAIVLAEGEATETPQEAEQVGPEEAAGRGFAQDLD